MSRGFTIIELIVVIAVIAMVATLAAPKVGGVMSKARVIAAERDLQMLREAIVDPERGLLRDIGGDPEFNPLELRLSDLMLYTNRFERWNDEKERGWRGPYVKANGEFPKGLTRLRQEQLGLRLRGANPYGEPGDPAVTDPWGMPYVLQIPLDEGNGCAAVTEDERFRFARVVSAGPNGRLDTPYDRFTNLTGNAAVDNDDLVLYLRNPETREE